MVWLAIVVTGGVCVVVGEVEFIGAAAVVVVTSDDSEEENGEKHWQQAGFYCPSSNSNVSFTNWASEPLHKNRRSQFEHSYLSKLMERQV